jgi:poly(3-hydroxybutyrate) depolymerase
MKEPSLLPWARGGIGLLLVAWTAAVSGASAAPPLADRLKAQLEGRSFRELLGTNSPDLALAPAECAEARALVWKAYAAAFRADPKRREEHDSSQMTLNRTLRYAAKRAGEMPAAGYPLFIALHGGGGAPPEINDRGWDHMKVYYAGSITNGLYVAPRGVSDTWNLHFQGESFALYDRLIENMIQFEDADPNRVYLLGYSAGGDGVYQIAPRMADRFAAADMSAGHHNGISPLNLCNLPFLIQGGELDQAYGRHRSFAEYAQRLDALARQYPGGYVHELFLHRGRGHGVLDNHSGRALQEIIENPSDWLQGGEVRTRRQNTNAIDWLLRFVRNPYPTQIVWEVAVNANRSGIGQDAQALWLTPSRGRQLYWLDLSAAWDTASNTNRIVARLDREKNAISVEGAEGRLDLLLAGAMLDLARPVQVRVDGQTLRVTPRPNLRHLVRTVAERGDPNYAFEARIRLEQGAEGWEAAAD